MDIWYYNDGELEQEKIAAEKWMRLIYESPAGSATLLHLVKRKALSRLYGMYCRTKFSASMIPKFIDDLDIDMDGCTGPYKNFAEFFAREKTNITFPETEGVLGSPCEGLVTMHNSILPEKLIAAKGSYFPLAELLDDEGLAESYRGGCMLKIRLTPAHYHRMHFFDDGVVTSAKFLDGDLFSVSPLALGSIARLYCRNKRAIILFESKSFGDVAIVEVGATFVGSIVHCFNEKERVKRGQQASYFLPGGSLVLIFFKNGAVSPNEVIISHTDSGYEVKVSVGDVLGMRLE